MVTVRGNETDATLCVRRECLRSKLLSGQGGIIEKLDTNLDRPRVIAGEAQKVIGHSEIHVSSVGSHRAAFVISWTYAVRDCDRLISIVENLHVIAQVGSQIYPCVVGVWLRGTLLSGREFVDLIGFAKGAL